MEKFEKIESFFTSFLVIFNDFLGLKIIENE